MRTLKDLRRRIESTGELGSVVRTMKTLAAVNIREYDRAAAAAAGYHEVLEMGFRILLREGGERSLTAPPTPGGPACAVVWGSDQGMVGQFNDRIASFAIRAMNELGVPTGKRTLIAVGERVSRGLRSSGQSVERTIPMPGSADAIGSGVMEILFALESWRDRIGGERIMLFYNRSRGGVSWHPGLFSLFPIDEKWIRRLMETEWKSRSLPWFAMERRELLSFMVHEYIFISLFRSFAQSLSSENASRLAAMQAAEKNIDDRLEELKRDFNHLRQSAITAELLDIVSGSLATGVAQ